MVILKPENQQATTQATEPLTGANKATITELCGEIDFLEKKNADLQARYTALFKLNHFS